MRLTPARRGRVALALGFAALVGGGLAAQQQPGPVTFQEILEGLKPDGANWLTFGGNFSNHRYSPLTQITPENVAKLQPQWTFQTGVVGNFETTSLLRDNVLYVTGPLNYNWAIDARTGKQIWRYRRELPLTGLTACCGLVNRGFAMLGDRLFMTTLDAHVLALDSKTGSVIWDAEMADYKTGHAATIAPIIAKDKVIVGIAGGEYGVRGWIDAYDANTGKRAWRYYTIPGPGEPGNETWSGDSWKTGGATIWTTGAYDPELNLIYYGTGNPGPDYHSASREGDNQWSDSIVAVDVDTGKLKWAYQFTPHDVHDYDSTQVPVLTDLEIGGQTRKVVLFANRNGFFYVLDRTNGKLLHAKTYVHTTWAKEIDAQGRPILLPGQTPDEKGEVTCPDAIGATNFWQPSFDPRQQLFFVTAREVCATFFGFETPYVPGQRFTGGAQQRIERGEMKPYSAIRAIDPKTVERKWEFVMPTPSRGGILTTASNLLFSGDNEGNVFALDSRNGKLLWRYQLGANLYGTSPTTHMVDGRQILLVPSGTTLSAWALPDVPRSTAQQ
ncbi:MAG: pyrroloquinoline quinone-dependent dehydrogenase [Vicinamibacterales bacterium]